MRTIRTIYKKSAVVKRRVAAWGITENGDAMSVFSVVYWRG